MPSQLFIDKWPTPMFKHDQEFIDDFIKKITSYCKEIMDLNKKYLTASVNKHKSNVALYKSDISKRPDKKDTVNKIYNEEEETANTHQIKEDENA